MRILGIDPGTIITGYGLVEQQQGKLLHVENGGIFPPKKKNFNDRIHYIFQSIEELIEKYKPQALALENIFFAKNAASALKLGHARGAVMVAAGRAQLSLYEYSANEVKLSVTGYGHASKEQIQKMVKTLLKLPDFAFADASDALAVAICHLHSHKLSQKVRSQIAS